ncbi:MAG: hypothetical protein ABIN58_06335, partial [candidate division WOR-3 bacterium]
MVRTEECLHALRSLRYPALISASILLLSILISIIVHPPDHGTFGIAGYTLYVVLILFGCYMMGALYGRQALAPIIYLAIATAVSTIVYVILHGLDENGGLISTTNYDLAIVVLAVGATALIVHPELMGWPIIWRMVAIVLIIAGIVATGAPEGIVVISALVATISVMEMLSLQQRGMWPHYISVNVIILMAAVIGMLTLWSHGRVGDVLSGVDHWGDGRIDAYHRAVTHVSLTGYGYSMTEYQINGGTIAHNSFLACLQQSGPFALSAMVAMTAITLWGNRRSAKYMIMPLMLIYLGMFDHMIWTALGVWWWNIMGIASRDATSLEVNPDYGIQKRALEIPDTGRSG